MGRRFMRGFRRGGARLLGRVGGLRTLGLQEVRSLERIAGMPAGLELGTATAWGGRPVALVVANRDGPDLVGWAPVAAALAPPDLVLAEVIVAAPLIGPATRRAAEAPGTIGPPIRLVAFPALGDSSSELVAQETVPASPGLRPAGAPARSVFDQTLRVLEGAAAVSGEGAVRQAPGGAVLFLRGIPALRVLPTGEGATVEFTVPSRSRVEVSAASFPTAAPEVHERTIELSQDPRLLDRVESERARSIDRVALAAGVRVVGRWLPWNSEGSDPIDWVGIDRDARPVLGLLRDDFTVADIPSVVAALSLFEDQRTFWAPEARGSARVCIAGKRVEPRAAAVLEGLGLDLEHLTRSGSSLDESPAAGRRGGRRSRRRRDRSESSETSLGHSGDSETTREPEEPREPRGRRETPDAEAVPAGRAAEPEQAVEEEGAAGPAEEPRRTRRRRGRGRGRRPSDAADAFSAEADRGAAGPEEAASDSEAASAEDAETPLSISDAEPVVPPSETTGLDTESERPKSEEDALGAEFSEADPVDEAVEAALVEVPSEEESPDPEPLEAEPAPRPRRSRAALVVRNDPESILAAFVLARERRTIESFWICAQDGLADFLKGRATDVGDNTDLLLVGFTAQPRARETVEAAEVFRGRLQWFDHREWAIEDLERLRDALGREAIVIVESGATPLAAVAQVSERRNRFTTKLLDFSAGRLSESDMDRWGFRLAGLIKRLADSSADGRPDIGPVLSGKPTELPDAPSVYEAEELWVKTNDPRVVHFGEYQMVVAVVPDELDAAEVSRRLRLSTASRISFVVSDAGSVALLACAEEKRHINLVGLVERITSRIAWAHAQDAADRSGRIGIDEISLHPERFEVLIGEIVRNKSILYG